LNGTKADVDVYMGATTIILSGRVFQELLSLFSEGLQKAAEQNSTRLLEQIVSRANQQEEPGDLVRSLRRAAQQGGLLVIAAWIAEGTLPQLVAKAHVRPFTLVVP
jgi:hypothetical protein